MKTISAAVLILLFMSFKGTSQVKAYDDLVYVSSKTHVLLNTDSRFSATFIIKPSADSIQCGVGFGYTVPDAGSTLDSVSKAAFMFCPDGTVKAYTRREEVVDGETTHVAVLAAEDTLRYAPHTYYAVYLDVDPKARLYSVGISPFTKDTSATKFIYHIARNYRFTDPASDPAQFSKIYVMGKAGNLSFHKVKMETWKNPGNRRRHLFKTNVAGSPSGFNYIAPEDTRICYDLQYFGGRPCTGANLYDIAGKYEIEIDVLPNGNNMNVGVSPCRYMANGEWHEMPAIVKFGAGSRILYWDDDGYVPTGLSYQADTEYTIRYKGNTEGTTFSAWMREKGSKGEKLICKNATIRGKCDNSIISFARTTGVNWQWRENSGSYGDYMRVMGVRVLHAERKGDLEPPSKMKFLTLGEVRSNIPAQTVPAQ